MKFLTIIFAILTVIVCVQVEEVISTDSHENSNHSLIDRHPTPIQVNRNLPQVSPQTTPDNPIVKIFLPFFYCTVLFRVVCILGALYTGDYLIAMIIVATLLPLLNAYLSD